MKKTIASRCSIAFALLIILVVAWSCKENILGPQVVDKNSPGPITNISVTNTPGGAIIRFNLPPDRDIAGVEARYTLQNGVETVLKVSNFTKEVTVAGFSREGSYKVALCAFDKSGNYSAPVDVLISPLKPSVQTIFESVRMASDFGGISVQWDNPSKAPVALIILARDTLTQRMTQIDAVYTSTATGDYSTRGMKPKENRFGVIVRDRFENYSDTLFAMLTPIEEVKIDPAKFRPIILPTDRDMENISNLWDGNRETLAAPRQPWVTLPEHFTFDMGVIAKLSRFKLYHYNWGAPYNYFFYYNTNPRFFEVWGATTPSPDGSWVGWTLLKDCEVVKPSGLPVGPHTDSRYATDEDIELARAGFEFKVPVDKPAVRYIRLVSKQAWLKSYKTCRYGDMEFFGQIQKTQ